MAHCRELEEKIAEIYALKAAFTDALLEIEALNEEAEQQEEEIVKLKDKVERAEADAAGDNAAKESLREKVNLLTRKLERQASMVSKPSICLPADSPCHCKFSSAGHLVKIEGCPLKNLKEKAVWAKKILEDIAK